MVNPVPGYAVTVPYGRRGTYWRACGWHTGVDIAAPKGTPIVAARSGVVRHRQRYGSAFGPHAFAIVCPDGSEDFYAHTLDSPREGQSVKAGERIARVGALGQATGPHLHFERHKRAGQWSCPNMTDPMESIVERGAVAIWYKYSGKPKGEQIARAGRYTRTDVDVPDPTVSGLEFHMLYANLSPVWRITDKSDPRYAAQRAAVRIKYVREGGDATGYQDYELSPLSGSFLITATHWESGRRGVGGRWHIKPTGDVTAVKLGTRYCKIAVVH